MSTINIGVRGKNSNEIIVSVGMSVSVFGGRRVHCIFELLMDGAMVSVDK